ncbi:MAG: nucleotidyl transferase AbiEii/AbiGii toxin family protein, partial [Lacisediminihabitans sp.]
MTTDDAGRLRASLEARIVNASEGRDANPLRRRLAYQRILRRLGEHADGGWVLKGGYLLEARLSSQFRATKDLDLAIREVGSGAGVMSLLHEALALDPDNDNFVFSLADPLELAVDARENHGWRVSVDALL